MLYYLFSFLKSKYDLLGAGLVEYLSFRAAVAFLLSLFIAFFFGKKIINFLRKKQIGESVRELGLQGQTQKAGTPTMGGVIIILAIIIPVLLISKLENIYIILLLLTTVSMGFLGFADDYIKVFKKNKDGLNGKIKLLGQAALGVIVGAVMFFNPDVVIREKNSSTAITIEQTSRVEESLDIQKFSPIEKHSTKTTIPFVKNNEFDYAVLLKPFCSDYASWAWIIFIPVVIFIIAAVSNGANLTDGIDGLAAGTSAIQVGVLGLLAWLSGNFIFASYLNIMYIPDVGELFVFASAFIGALVGFLWYNTYPAQVFMGDTGSLTIGGIIAVLAICIRKELLLPIIAGVFLIENLSVVLQVSYFRYTKKKYGEGKRLFLMSPIHHHFQKQGIHESKIVARFWIIGVILAVLSVVTLKLR